MSDLCDVNNMTVSLIAREFGSLVLRHLQVIDEVVEHAYPILMFCRKIEKMMNALRENVS